MISSVPAPGGHVGSELALIEDLADPPAILFVRGRSLLDFGARVAVVGARNCSDLGRELAGSIGEGLGAAGACLVSGAARGIDAAAHEGALGVGGTTIAVLGCGIDIAYPSGSRFLIARIAGAGAVVSEYPPGVPAEPFRGAGDEGPGQKRRRPVRAAPPRSAISTRAASPPAMRPADRDSHRRRA